jgi:tellurium resistance protein TerD
MAVSLTKGGNVNLSKEAPGLAKIRLGLGWDVRKTDGAGFDLDALAFMVTASGKVRSDADFIFFNNKTSADGTVQHTGDNRSGEGDGDDESIVIDLANLAADVEKVIAAVVIFDGETKGQTFGYIRVINENGGTEISRFDLSEDGSTVTAMVFGEIYRNNGEWKFKAIGQGFNEGFKALVASYGVNV